MFGFGKNKGEKNKQDKKIEQKQPVIEVSKAQDAADDSGWISKLKTGLSQSSSKLNEGMKDIFVRKKLDEQTLEDLEDLLITSDLGVDTAALITSKLAKSKFNKEVTTEEIKRELSLYIAAILNNVAVPLNVIKENKPHVILVCGVNGSGKTTTIGKLASNFKAEGKSVMIAACDTFRAAAVEQLEEWSRRSGCEIIKGSEGADPASVAFEAYTKARAENASVLIIDTAGRLQNKKNLMEQLQKIVRVLQKIDETLPHDSIIVLDATTGQNANSQVKVFNEMINLTGIVVTKLDGTAKGGVVVSLAKQFGLPIHAIGVGEAIGDLRSFEAEAFADSLVGL
jgi:fused signal recognition particle receptor